MQALLEMKPALLNKHFWDKLQESISILKPITKCILTFSDKFLMTENLKSN